MREILAAGLTWKEYTDGLPSVGFIGSSGKQVRRHNPCSFFSDVRNSPDQLNNLVPFTQFAADLRAGTLPNFALIVPDNNHDAHDGTLKATDDWLRANIPNPLPNDTILIVTFDESGDSDKTNCGGQVAWTVSGVQVKPRYKSGTLYQHSSTLRTICDMLGINTPAAAAGAPSMAEFFSSAPGPTPTPTPSPTPDSNSDTLTKAKAYPYTFTETNSYSSTDTVSLAYHYSLDSHTYAFPNSATDLIAITHTSPFR